MTAQSRMRELMAKHSAADVARVAKKINDAIVGEASALAIEALYLTLKMEITDHGRSASDLTELLAALPLLAEQRKAN